MKTLILIIYICIGSIWQAYSQIPSLVGVTVIGDEALAGQSMASYYYYYQLDNKASSLRDQVYNSTKAYNLRLQYLVGFVMTSKINSTLDNVENRIDALEAANNSLTTVVNYSKKKKNTLLIDDVREEFDILKAEFNRDYGVLDATYIIDFKMDTPVSSYGERINLYYNMERTTNRLHRLMDIIEDNVDSTVAYDRQVSVMKTDITTVTP